MRVISRQIQFIFTNKRPINHIELFTFEVNSINAIDQNKPIQHAGRVLVINFLRTLLTVSPRMAESNGDSIAFEKFTQGNFHQMVDHKARPTDLSVLNLWLRK